MQFIYSSPRRIKSLDKSYCKIFQATPKVPLKKKKKGPKGKKTKGRKPKLNQDDKDDSDYEPKLKDAEFKCGACKTVQPTLEALKGNKMWSTLLIIFL